MATENVAPPIIRHESPGNSHAYVKLPLRCLFCASVLLPGDYRWFCVRCFRRHGTATIADLLQHDRFRMDVSPVAALEEAGRG